MTRRPLATNLSISLWWIAALLLAGGQISRASAFSPSRPPLVAKRPVSSAATATRGDGGGGLQASSSAESDDGEAAAATPSLKDRSSDASALFGNLRVPAALIAGASAGSAFALPLADTDGLRVGMVKRLYILLQMGSLSSELVTVIVSTLAMAGIASSPNGHEPAANVGEFLKREYELEWVIAKFHFLAGIIGFVLGLGLRAWISIACPIVARAALGFVVSGMALGLAFVDSYERSSGLGKWGLLGLPLRALTLLLGRMRKDPLFAVAFLSASVTWGYTLRNVPHVYNFLAKVPSA